MKKNQVLTTAFFALLMGLWIPDANRLLAETLPGPLHVQQSQQAAPASASPQTQGPQELKEKPPQKQTLSGNWKLNRGKSDDGRMKVQQAQELVERIGGTGPYGLPGGQPYPQRSVGDGGSGPTGEYGGGTGRPATFNERELKEIVYPPELISLTIKDAEVDLTDDQNRKRVFYTDGRMLQKSKDDKYQELTAHWEGNRLISEGKSPQGSFDLHRSFELASNGHQLYESIEIVGNINILHVAIRYVYDRK